MPPQASKKRKEAPTKLQSKNPRPNKRTKLHQARTILAEPPDRALNQNGDLDVAAFVKAREFEIRAMSKSMESSKAALSTRAFQHVPRSMRRRTASHNVKKVPKRLRIRAAKEMKEDNTPTGKDRRKKLTTHKRLRLEKAKALKKKGRLKKAQREAENKSKPGETDPEKMVQIVPRLPRAKKGVLVAPSRPPARFRKRQVNKSWLPTHVWHAKRAHMTEPMFPLWRFAIPLSPTEKTFRTTHRAVNMRGCVAWDTSYMSTIGLEGVEASMIGVFRSMGFGEEVLTGSKGRKWRQGTRIYEGWMRERDKNEVLIAPVTVFWCASAADGSEDVSEERKRKVKRKCLLRIHPSAFFQIWNDITKVAKMQRPPVIAEDLRFEIGSIEITGTGSTEALLAALHPLSEKSSDTTQETKSSTNEDSVNIASDTSMQDAWEDFETPGAVWSKLAGLTNSASLPPRALLGFNISDPRLRAPVRTIPFPDPDTANTTLIDLLGDWPPDSTQKAADMFDRTKRLAASRLLASQKSINRRKSACLPGTSPSPSPHDPSIPVLLYTSRPPASAMKSGQGKWTVLLPWSCILPVWYTLMHYPLSSGETPRFGCLNQQRQIAFESNMPWFPGDFPGTKAGWEWECMERRVAKRQWDRKPKGRRIEYESLRLGEGRKKGEVGKGWACDWERVVLGREKYEDLEAEGDKAAESEEYAVASQVGDLVDSLDYNPQTDISIPTGPPHGLMQFLIPPSGLPQLDKTKISRTALAPVLIHLLPSGHPSRCARIYRLPTQDPGLLTRWLALLNQHHNKTTNNKKRQPKQNRSTSSSKTNPYHHISSARVTSTSTPLISLPPHQRAHHMALNLFSHLPPNNPTAAKTNPTTDQPPVPEEHDLIGFTTSANFSLGEGRCAALANLVMWRCMGWDTDVHTGAGGGGGDDASGPPSSHAEEQGQEKGVRKGGEGGGGGGEEVGGAAAQARIPAQGDIKSKDRGVAAAASAGAGVGEKTILAKSQGERGKGGGGGYCIVRDAGMSVGRLARWEFAPSCWA